MTSNIICRIWKQENMELRTISYPEKVGHERHFLARESYFNIMYEESEVELQCSLCGTILKTTRIQKIEFIEFSKDYERVIVHNQKSMRTGKSLEEVKEQILTLAKIKFT